MSSTLADKSEVDDQEQVDESELSSVKDVAGIFQSRIQASPNYKPPTPDLKSVFTPPQGFMGGNAFLSSLFHVPLVLPTRLFLIVLITCVLLPSSLGHQTQSLLGH